MDASSYCLTNPRFSDEHKFPDDVEILLDSHCYRNLIKDLKPVWKSVDFDNDGGQVSLNNNRD